MVPAFPPLGGMTTLLQQIQKVNSTRQSNPINSLGMKKLKSQFITKSPSMIDKKLHGRRLNSAAGMTYELPLEVILF
jgi:hypothetical protein